MTWRTFPLGVICNQCMKYETFQFSLVTAQSGLLHSCKSTSRPSGPHFSIPSSWQDIRGSDLHHNILSVYLHVSMDKQPILRNYRTSWPCYHRAMLPSPRWRRDHHRSGCGRRPAWVWHLGQAVQTSVCRGPPPCPGQGWSARPGLLSPSRPVWPVSPPCRAAGKIGSSRLCNSACRSSNIVRNTKEKPDSFKIEFRFVLEIFLLSVVSPGEV